MKKVKILIVGLILLCVLASCSSQANTDPAHQQSSVDSSIYSLQFDSEEQFLHVIQEVKQKRREKDDQPVSFKTRDGQTKQYSATSDPANFDSLSEYYKPSQSPMDTVISSVSTDGKSVAISYANEKDTTNCTFVWFRKPMTEEYINGMLGRGAISEETKEYKGTKYLVLFFSWSDESEKGFYNIWWIKDGQGFTASFSSDFTEEEALDFCQYEAVAIKEK